METRANYVLIGTFTLGVVVAALAFVLWFSGNTDKVARKAYRIVFTSSVSGLSVGSWVTFNGLRVGEVSSVDLGADPGQVEALVEVTQRTPIKTDTRARLEYQGLTGVASVALTGGSVSTKVLEGSLASPPVILAERSDYQNIVESIQRLSGRVDVLLARIDSILDDNASTISDVARNVKILTEKLDTAVNVLNSVLESARDFVAQPGGRDLFVRFGDAANAMRTLANNLDARIKETAEGIRKFSGAGLRDYQALAENGRRTLDELERTVKSLKDNPQQFLFGSKPSVPEYNAAPRTP